MSCSGGVQRSYEKPSSNSICIAAGTTAAFHDAGSSRCEEAHKPEAAARKHGWLGSFGNALTEDGMCTVHRLYC